MIAASILSASGPSMPEGAGRPLPDGGAFAMLLAGVEPVPATVPVPEVSTGHAEPDAAVAGVPVEVAPVAAVDTAAGAAMPADAPVTDAAPDRSSPAPIVAADDLPPAVIADAPTAPSPEPARPVMPDAIPRPVAPGVVERMPMPERLTSPAGVADLSGPAGQASAVIAAEPLPGETAVAPGAGPAAAVSGPGRDLPIAPVIDDEPAAAAPAPVLVFDDDAAPDTDAPKDRPARVKTAALDPALVLPFATVPLDAPATTPTVVSSGRATPDRASVKLPSDATRDNPRAPIAAVPAAPVPDATPSEPGSVERVAAGAVAPPEIAPALAALRMMPGAVSAPGDAGAPTVAMLATRAVAPVPVEVPATQAVAAPVAPVVAAAVAETPGPVPARTASRRVMRDPVPVATVPEPDAAPVAKAPSVPTAGAMLVASGDERHVAVARHAVWADGIARDIAATGASSGSVRFTVASERLGPIDVAVMRGADGTDLRLTARSDAAQAVLDAARPQLVAEARAQGLHLRDAPSDGAPTAAAPTGDPQAIAVPAPAAAQQTPQHSLTDGGYGGSGGGADHRSHHGQPQPRVARAAADPAPAREASDGAGDGLYA